VADRTKYLFIFSITASYMYKNKRKVVPVLNKAPSHEDIWGCGGIAPPFLTSAPDKGE
jgi:hypothetical protein